MMTNALRTILLTCFLTLLMCLPGCIEWNNETEQNTVTIEGKGTFTSIQSAIDNASDGDILYVSRGTYNETLIINKPISLIGENRDNTIITSNDSYFDYKNIVIKVDNCTINRFTIVAESKPSDAKAIAVQSSNNVLTNLTIADYAYGIYLGSRSEQNNISNNHLDGNDYALYLTQADHNSIISNTITGSSRYGIYISSSNSNYIADNHFTHNGNASRIKGASNNRVTHNVFSQNYRAVYFCCNAKNNFVYYNVFLNNTIHADDSIGNHWDMDTLGNYWDDYNGTDDDGDGIGDIPYTIQYYRAIKDSYPLISRPADL